MELIGRLTADATVAVTSSGAQLVKFRIACNHRFKTKQFALRKFTTFFDCSYWQNTSVAKHLLKGSLVELSGRVGAYAYLDSEKQPKARLNFHVNGITLHVRASKIDPTPHASAVEQATDDIPF